MTIKDPRDNLKNLAIFHYVFAGLGFLFALFPLIYVALGVLMASSTEFQGLMVEDGISGNVAPNIVGVVSTALIIFGVSMSLVAVTISVLAIYSGRQMAKQKKHTFSLVFAGFICILFPFGTALGIFTLIYLCKAEIGALYNQATSHAQRDIFTNPV